MPETKDWDRHASSQDGCCDAMYHDDSMPSQWQHADLRRAQAVPGEENGFFSSGE